MPRPSAIGSAPAAIIFRPSRKIASASTVAVVVPSPATSLVLLAASLTSWAPRFSYGIVQLDVLGDGHAVLGHLGRAPALVEHGVAAAGAERAADGPGQLSNAGGQRPAGLVLKDHLLCHVIRPPEMIGMESSQARRGRGCSVSPRRVGRAGKLGGENEARVWQAHPLRHKLKQSSCQYPKTTHKLFDGKHLRAITPTRPGVKRPGSCQCGSGGGRDEHPTDSRPRVAREEGCLARRWDAAAGIEERQRRNCSCPAPIGLALSSPPSRFILAGREVSSPRRPDKRKARCAGSSRLLY